MYTYNIVCIFFLNVILTFNFLNFFLIYWLLVSNYIYCYWNSDNKNVKKMFPVQFSQVHY